MNTIWKYPILLMDLNTIKVPALHNFIQAGFDPTGQMCVWVEVNSDAEKIEKEIYIVGTGNPIPKNAKNHINSFNDRSFVWHVYSN